jgi:hypothetical protein
MKNSNDCAQLNGIAIVISTILLFENSSNARFKENQNYEQLPDAAANSL